MGSETTYYAHLLPLGGGWRKHSLEEHLEKVGCKAAGFSEAWDSDSKQWILLAGLWHDLGKYSLNFQTMLKQKTGFEAHLEEQVGRVNHSSAGALHARKILGEHAGKILGYIIAGHHAGLPDWDDGLAERLSLTKGENQDLYQAAIKENIPEKILNPSILSKKLPGCMIASPEENMGLAPSFWIRMLFSCLVDADRLDTEAFMDPNKSLLRQGHSELHQIHEFFIEHLNSKTRSATPNVVNNLRKQVLKRCIEQSNNPPGVYTLTVPTGGGKTLSSMAFALSHALTNGQKRIIYVLPFTSILEQTAQVFRSILSSLADDCVIEHHSNLDPDKSTAKSHLATENWDAPIRANRQLVLPE